MSQPMEAAVEGLVGSTGKVDLDAEFEGRLHDSGSLAFRVAYGVLRHRQDAEDVAQEALTRAYKSIARLRDRTSFRSWLVRISWRLALDHQRAANRRTRREEDAPVPTASTEGDAVASGAEFRVLLWQAIGALPEKQRQVVVLAGILGHDLKQVGELLGISHGTVRSRMHAARKRLAETLR